MEVGKYVVIKYACMRGHVPKICHGSTSASSDSSALAWAGFVYLVNLSFILEKVGMSSKTKVHPPIKGVKAPKRKSCFTYIFGC